jgi:urease accessory protein UreE
MTIVETIQSVSETSALFPQYQQDTLTMTFDERRRGHGRRRSDGGIEFAISLPPGAVLKNGDCFVLPAERMIVAVKEAGEAVYVVRPKTPQQWAFYAYHVGNRHQQVMIGETELIFLQNPAVRSVLQQLHVEFETDTRPFTAALANIHEH